MESLWLVDFPPNFEKEISQRAELYRLCQTTESLWLVDFPPNFEKEICQRAELYRLCQTMESLWLVDFPPNFEKEISRMKTLSALPPDVQLQSEPEWKSSANCRSVRIAAHARLVHRKSSEDRSHVARHRRRPQQLRSSCFCGYQTRVTQMQTRG